MPGLDYLLAGRRFNGELSECIKNMSGPQEPSDGRGVADDLYIVRHRACERFVLAADDRIFPIIPLLDQIVIKITDVIPEFHVAVEQDHVIPYRNRPVEGRDSPEDCTAQKFFQRYIFDHFSFSCLYLPSGSRSNRIPGLLPACLCLFPVHACNNSAEGIPFVRPPFCKTALL